MRIVFLFLCLLGSVVAEQFRPLFNGTDFAGWGGAGKTELNGYLWKDGVVSATSNCQNLTTEKEFSDFILKFEFRLTAGANNGLGFHYPGEGTPAFTGMEIQILDDSHPKYADLKPYQFHGGLYTLVAPKKGFLKPVGEWNEQTVTVQGPSVKVELNGVMIMTANLDELNQSHAEHAGAKRRKGFLTFCGHGDIVSFRKVRIREL